MVIVLSIVLAIIIVLTTMAIIKKPGSVYKNKPEEQNPMEGKRVKFIEDLKEKANADGVCGYLVAIGDTDIHRGFYDRVGKRCIDLVLSILGLIILSPILLGLIIAIKIDDPGPIFFVQKRVGKNKQYFKLHKFRSMKMSTPHDVPTHMLENPEQYITRIGRFLRKSSLDELPQIGDIFIGNMSIIGPRPALWNQELLIAERDKYGANDIKPGLTGWAQINGRDELEILMKAKLDGEYVKQESFLFDCPCFLETVYHVLHGDGVVEGGSSEVRKNESQKE